MKDQICSARAEIPQKKTAGKKSNKFMVKKCGKLTRNPFLNYVRQLRSIKNFRNMRELLKEAGNNWKRLKECEKKKYTDEANKMKCNSDTSSPAFYTLGEHTLGRTLRKDLARYKALLDDAVDDNVRKYVLSKKMSTRTEDDMFEDDC